MQLEMRLFTLKSIRTLLEKVLKKEWATWCEDETSFKVTKHRAQRFTIRIDGDENNEIDIFWEEGKIVKITINMEVK